MAAVRGARAEGFTLLEAVIATLVVSVALLLASGLLRTSLEGLALAGRRALDPVPELALGQLRADLRAAGGVAGGEPLWSREPMSLNGHPLGRVDYLLVGGELRRRVLASGGGIAGERTVLTGVSTFRWRRPHPGLGLVEVELGYRRTGRLRPGRSASGKLLPIAREERRRLAIAPRRSGRPGW